MSTKSKATEIPVAEWMVAAVGALCVLVSLVFVTWEALSRGDAPPKVVLAVKSITPGAETYVVEFEARNDGDHTAANLQIEGVLFRGTDTLEKRNATMDYLPPASRRRGGIFFRHDPRGLRVLLTPVGYQNP